jgi:hypothetical protein
LCRVIGQSQLLNCTGRENIERLDKQKAVPQETLRLYCVTVEELRSAMNHRFTEMLRDREMKDCAYYGREVRSLEEQVES